MLTPPWVARLENRTHYKANTVFTMFPFFFSQRVLKTITKQQYEKCSRLSHVTKNYFWRCFYYLEPNKREVINVISRSIVVWLPLDICTFIEHKLFKRSYPFTVCFECWALPCILFSTWHVISFFASFSSFVMGKADSFG